MKKRIFLCFAFCMMISLMSGCNSNHRQNEPTEDEIIEELLKDDLNATQFKVYFNYMDGSEYQYVTVQPNKIVLRPSTPKREGYRFIDWYTDKNYTETYQFSNPVTKSIMLYAKWEVSEMEDYSYLLDEYLPNEVTEDLEFPTKINEVQGSHLIWSTSDEYTISSLGVVNPGYEDITVTVTLEVNIQGESIFYSRDCVVKGISFGKLKTGDVVFGYCSTWNFKGFSDDELSKAKLKADVINVSFAYVNKDFTLDMTDVLSSLITKTGYLSARKKGVRVVLSIQGYGDNSKNFSNAAANESTRKKFVESVLNVVEKYHFDGIDIDWEYPGWFTPTYKDSEKENYTLLIKELYETLKAKDESYLLTAALPAGIDGYVRYDLAEVSKYLDYIHLMSYDLETSASAVHHTALYSSTGSVTNTLTTTQTGSGDASVKLYVNQGVPKEKIVLGVAFYGKYTYVANKKNGGIGTATTKSGYSTITYTRIAQNYLSKIGDGVIYYWDNECCAPYLFVEEDMMFITYENEKSIKEKCKYVDEEGLGGIMIWEIGEDETGTLMKAVNRGMHR